MEESQLVYLIAAFPDLEGVERAVRMLRMPENRVSVLGDDQTALEEVANRRGIRTALNEEIELDSAQAERLRWHLENRGQPLLAVAVLAEQGRDVRLRLQELGGQLIADPPVDLQAGDASVDPGMDADEPELPPHYGRLSDAITPSGAPEDS
ncbi:MAG: hypothetical protein M3220_05375 [Chloroflexota bacterium]|nr:hypothetical protein [Chloroflexota bacterium]